MSFLDETNFFCIHDIILDIVRGYIFHVFILQTNIVFYCTT